jgi:UPF0755 protein
VIEPGRRGNSDDGAGGVPPFYWVSTGGAGSYEPAPRGAGPYEAYDSPGYDTSAYDSPGHDSYDTGQYDAGRYDASAYEPQAYQASAYDGTRFDTTGFEAVREVPDWGAPGWHTGYGEPTTGGLRRVSGVLDRELPGAPAAEPDWWRHRPEDGVGDRPAPFDAPEPRWSSEHPSQPVPAPLPPLPTGAWDKLSARAGGPDDGAFPGDRYPADGSDDATAAHPLRPAVDRRPDPLGDAETGALAPDWDRTGALDVIGANVDEGAGRRGRRWRRSRAGRHEAPPAEHRDDHDPGDDADLQDDDLHDEVLAHDDDFHDDDLQGGEHPVSDDDIPLKPYDRRAARARRRKRPIALVISLLVLGGLVAGIVVGGQKLLTVLNPSSQDFTGQGSGSVEIRVQNGDTLSDIARTLVDAGVIASVAPFVDAAEERPEATGIQPGVYGMREQMSGRAALDLLLDPASRLVTRVTIREGLTAKATLAQLAEATGTPLDQLEAAAADPAALGVPEWAGGNLEGLLFPATYDFEPGTPPAVMLRAMVTRANQALDELNVPADRRQRLVTEASIVQAEAASPEDMAKVATVLNNRIADGMPLQLDTTVNYANGKSGIITTPEDRANPSPYNTYVHAGLPPGPISNPGEDALRAVLNPTPGDWRFFVVVNPDTGETRFARTAEEHQQNVLLFQQWLRENPGG